MGRVISTSTATSNNNSASGVLQVAAGNAAISVNDLLVMNPRTGQVSGAQCTDYAAVNIQGAAIVGTTVSGVSSSNYLNYRKGAIVDTDGSIYVLGCIAAGTYGDGLKVSKYSPTGTLLNQTTVEASGATSDASIVKLSNGNFAICWGNNVLQYFAIVDSSCNIVVAKTSTGIIGNGGNFVYLPDLAALSGGGFVIAGQLANGSGISYVIYTNAGAVTKALTAVTNSPTAGSGNYAKLAQVANGNIVIAIGCSATGGAKTLGFAIYDAAGTAKVAYTQVSAVATTLPQQPEISVIGNLFCIGWNDDTNACAYVYDNTGVTTATLQGAGYTAANANPVNKQIKVTNDGTAFWFIFGTTSGNTATVVYVPTTGTGYVTTVTTASFLSSTQSIIVDAAIAAGVLIIAASGTNNITVHKIDQTSHKVSQTDALTNVTGHNLAQIIPTFDYSIAIIGQYDFAVQKFAPASIIGTAQTSVAAGNAGTLLLANEGPGGFPTNAILGTSGKPFSHGNGNRGVMFSNSVALAGVGNPRNIN